MKDECEVPEINGSLAGELARVVRYTTAAIGGYMVAQGYMTQATVELVSGVIVTATPLLVGMAVARIQRQHVATVIKSLKASRGDSEPPKGD